jgi:hypothetical protein
MITYEHDLMNKTRLGWCIHFSAYYLCWIVSFYFAAQNEVYLGTFIGFSIIGIQILWQWVNRLPYQHALMCALLIGLIGSLTDTLWLHFGFISFAANPFTPYFTAPWMICIWLSFGLNLVILNEKLMQHYLLSSLFILFLMPLGYKIGAACHIVIIKQSLLFYSSVGITWALLLPLSFYIYNQFLRKIGFKNCPV